MEVMAWKVELTERSDRSWFGWQFVPDDRRRAATVTPPVGCCVPQLQRRRTVTFGSAWRLTFRRQWSGYRSEPASQYDNTWFHWTIASIFNFERRKKKKKRKIRKKAHQVCIEKTWEKKDHFLEWVKGTLTWQAADGGLVEGAVLRRDAAILFRSIWSSFRLRFVSSSSRLSLASTSSMDLLSWSIW
jgi:hypothetical protein